MADLIPIAMLDDPGDFGTIGFALPPDAPPGLRVLETRDLVSEAYVFHLVRDDGAHVRLGHVSILNLMNAYPGLPHIDVDWPAAFAALEATGA